MAPERRLVVDRRRGGWSPPAVVEELVAVVPLRERAGELAVGEGVGRVVLDVLGDPAERDRPELGLQDDPAARPGSSRRPTRPRPSPRAGSAAPAPPGSRGRRRPDPAAAAILDSLTNCMVSSPSADWRAWGVGRDRPAGGRPGRPDRLTPGSRRGRSWFGRPGCAADRVDFGELCRHPDSDCHRIGQRSAWFCTSGCGRMACILGFSSLTDRST